MSANEIIAQQKMANERYTELYTLGAGSQGCVIAAKDEIEGYEVAIKRVKCDSITAAKYAFQEMMVLKYTYHPNIIELIDHFTEARNAEEMNDFNLVMPKMEGTIAELNMKNPLLEFEKTTPVIIHQLLCALEQLHQRNIIHRDVKPQNIGIGGDWELKLMDLGMATEKRIEESRMTSGVTTLHYRAPEVLMGLDYGSAVDIWAVGCLLYELLTGEVLFKACDEWRQITDIIQKIGMPDKEFMEKLPEGVKKSFEKIPSKTPQSFKELFPTLNAEACDLLSNLLVLDPKKRLTAEQALAHSYFADVESDDDFEIPQNCYQLPKTPDTLADIKKAIFDELKNSEIFYF